MGKELRLLWEEIDGDLEDYPLRRKAFWKDYTKEEWEQRLRQLPRVYGGCSWQKNHKEQLKNKIKRMRELEAEIRRRQEAGESITEDGEPGP